MADGSVNHIGIATTSLDQAEEIWNALGFVASGDAVSQDQGVKIRYLEGAERTRIELLEPLGEDTPVGRFIKQRGPGVQQIALNVSDLQEKINELKTMGVRLITDEPVLGADGHMIAFLHPSSCGGVLVELIQDS